MAQKEGYLAVTMSHPCFAAIRMGWRVVRRSGHSCVTLALCLLLATPAPAPAYIDPGAGSMLVQVTIGAIAAGLTLCKLYWKKITGFFRSPPEE